MEQLVLIIPRVGTKLDIKQSIKKIVSYVGTRMVDSSENESVPAVLLESPLSKKDKERLQEIVFASNGDGVLAFITLKKDTDLMYIDATINDDEED